MIIMEHNTARAGENSGSQPPCIVGSLCPRPRLMTAFNVVDSADGREGDGGETTCAASSRTV
jgi:hypothetical protein